jgi:hypothetical protein
VQWFFVPGHSGKENSTGFLFLKNPMHKTMPRKVLKNNLFIKTMENKKRIPVKFDLEEVKCL